MTLYNSLPSIAVYNIKTLNALQQRLVVGVAVGFGILVYRYLQPKCYNNTNVSSIYKLQPAHANAIDACNVGPHAIQQMFHFSFIWRPQAMRILVAFTV